MALGAALLLPLRDDRRGQRATFLAGAGVPLNVDFGALAPPVAEAEEPPGGPSHGVAPPSVWAVVQEWFNVVRARRPKSAANAAIDAAPAAETLADEHLGEERRTRERLAGELSLTEYDAASTFADDDLSTKAHAAETYEIGTQTFAEQVASLSSAGAPVIDQVRERCAPEIAEPAASPATLAAQPLPPLVVQAERPPYERMVPLTRLPLRSQATSLEWFRLTVPAADVMTRAERHALLAEFALAGSDGCVDALMLAYREEDVEGRMLAIRALLRIDASRGRPVFIEALRAGTDGERALAIDALVALGERDALVPAFSDRVEAIAAQAALAYVGTNVPADYRRALEPYIEAPRIEALLALLSGFLQ